MVVYDRCMATLRANITSTEQLGRWVKKRRTAVGMKVVDLAAQSQVHYNTILRVEAGQPCSPSTLEAVVDALGYDIEYRITRKEA